MKNENVFEDKYFKDIYGHISDFSEKTSKKNKNWFRGILHAINKYTNILDGKNKSAIEFGCGSGDAAQVIYEQGYKVTSTDISSYATRKAKKLYPKIHFFKHDMQEKIENKKRYDLVIAFDVIEHLENPEKAIKNMYDLIKSNGLVLCSTPNDYAHERRVPTHINVKKPDQWKRIFHEAGFKTVKTRQMTFLPFFYRFHWRLNLVLPFGINFHFPIACSPVFIFAYK